MLQFRSLIVVFYSTLFLACNSGTDTSAQTSSSKVEDNESSISVWEVASNPEAIAIGRGVIYATHFGDELKPMEQDGDGYIASYDANGGFIEKLVSGLDAPKGMEVIGNQVFVADVDSLLGFSTKDGSRSFSASFTGEAQFLNGLAAANEGSLYVSATDAGKIWEVSLLSGEYSLVASVPHVNGITVSEDKSVIFAVQYNSQDAGSGHLLAVNPLDGTMVQLGSYTGLLDGVFEHKGAVYFTDWNPSGFGRVLRYDLKSKETTIVLEDERLKGPADFEVLNDGLALIPMLTGSQILGIRFK